MAIILSSKSSFAEKSADVTGLKFEQAFNSQQLLRLLDQRQKEDLVVIADDIDLDEAVQTAETLRVSRPSLSVILLRDRLEMNQVRSAMASGIRNVVLASDGSGLAKACESALKVARDIRRAMLKDGANGAMKAKVITVYSAKGGVGKTTISVNLALAFAKLGHRTCLLDFDLQFGDVAVALGLHDPHSIVDALPEKEEMSREEVLGLLQNHSENLEVLLAPTSPVYAEEVTASLVGKIMAKLADEFEYIVIDSPPAFTDVILEAFDHTDLFLLVTTPDSPSFKNLALAVATLKTIGFETKKFRVLVNRVSSKFGMTTEELKSLVFSLTHLSNPLILPDSKEVTKSSASSKPVFSKYSRSKISQEFAKIAKVSIKELTHKGGM